MINLQENQNYLKPRVIKGLFYMRDNWDFEYAVFALLDKEMKESDYIPQLHPVLKSLRLFPRVSGQISNGGFDQLYFNGYEDAVKECIEGLYETGEDKVADILRFSYAFYKITENPDDETAKSFSQLSKEEQFEKLKNFQFAYDTFRHNMENRYEAIGMDLNEMNREFWDIYPQTMLNLVKHIKTNVNSYLLDEDGKPFDENFTGVYEYHNDAFGYILPMQNGKPHGNFQKFDYTTKGYSTTIDNTGYYENGFLKKNNYKMVWNQRENKPFTQFFHEYSQHNGKRVITQIKCYENTQNPEEQRRHFEHEYNKKIGEQKEWYENGTIRKVETISYENEDDEKTEIRHWQHFYENGQISGQGKSKRFDLITACYFHKNGQKEREIYLIDENRNEYANAWHEEGSLAVKTIVDDNGKFVEYWCYYPNGIKSLEFAYLKAGHIEIAPRNAWDEQGNQILKDGTGKIDLNYFTDYKWLNRNEIVSFKDSKMHGLRQEFNRDNTIYKETHYENGLKHGLEIIYHNNGQISWRTEFDHDVQMSYEKFDENGILLKSWKREQ